VKHVDYITQEQARADIVALGLPQIVLDIVDERELPIPNLDLQFRVPYEIFWLDAAGQAEYVAGRVTPLWAGNSGYTIVAYHHAPERRGFFRFDLEGDDPRDTYPVGLSWQQVLVEEFQEMWEGERTPEELRALAALFGFAHVGRLTSELEGSDLDTFEKSDAWRAAFIESIRD
jgi:hypothetical protein